MNDVGHGAKAADLAHEFISQRDQMAGQIAKGSEARVLRAQPP